MAAISYGVYFLIRRLSKTEKAYFKKFASKYGKKEDELLLFDLINNVLKNIEDPKEVAKRVESAYKRKRKKDNFALVKNKLLGDLTKALSEYDRSQKFESRLLHTHLEIKALIKRNILDHGLKMLKKALIEIEQREAFNLMILFAEQEAYIGVCKNNKEIISRAYVRKSYALSQMNHLFDLQSLYEKVYDVHRTEGQNIDGNLSNRLQPLLQAFKEMDFAQNSNTVLFNYHSLGKLIAFIASDMPKTVHHLSEMVSIIKQNPTLFEEKGHAALATYCDLITHSFDIEGLDYYEKYFEEFTKLPAANNQIEQYKKAMQLKIELLRMHQLKDFTKVEKLEKQFWEIKDTINPNTRNSMYGNLIAANYWAGNKENLISLIYAQLELNTKDTKRTDMLILDELVLLILHYEDCEYELLNNLIRSLNNRIKKSLTIGINEKAIIDFFKKAIGSAYGTETQLIKDTLQILEEHNYKVSLGNFDFIKWFDKLLIKKEVVLS